MIGAYHPLLVALSVLVASAASYAALDLTGRVTAAVGRVRVGWLVGGAFAMGVGIWSMHFIGMLAFRVYASDGGPDAAVHAAGRALPMLYDVPEMAASVAIAVLAAALALAVVGRRTIGAVAFGAASLAMGAAIGGMHYVAMASLRLPARVSYHPPLVLASIGVAVGASFAALWLAFRLRDDRDRVPVARRLGAAVVMGVAISGMHYTAMAAARFTLVPEMPESPDPVPGGALLATNGLAGTVVAATLAILALALLGAAGDRWLRRRLARAATHERLYRDAETARLAADAAHAQLQEQAGELEQQIEEAQALAEELEQTNEQLHQAATAAEQARIVAERSEAGFRRIFEDSPLPMWVYDAATLAFRDVNAAALQHTGWSREALLAATLRDIRPAEDLPADDLLVSAPALETPALEAPIPDATSRRRTRHQALDGTIREVEVATQAAPFAGPGLQLAVIVDVTDQVRAQQRDQLLAEASRALGASLNYAATLEHVARLAVPALADWCAVDVAREPGDPYTLDHVAVAHVDAAHLASARELRRCYPPPPDAPRGAPAVVRTGQSEFYPTLPDAALVAAAHDADHLRLLRAGGIRSVIVVPLAAHDRVLGALTLVTAGSQRRFTDADLALAEELGRRAGLAIDSARRYAAEQAARYQAEATADRIARLQAVTASLSAPLSGAEVARIVVGHATAALRGQAGAVSVLDTSGEALLLLDAVGYSPTAMTQFARIPLDVAFPLTDAVRSGTPIVLASAAERDARYPQLAELRRENGPGAVAAIPLTFEGRCLGALGINFPEDVRLDRADHQLLVAIAQQCAQALERARLYDAERTARTAAEQANASKSQFLANMSHELRTPLNAIGGHVELVEMGLHGPVTAAQREALGRVQRAQHHLLGLITDVLNYAQLEAGRVRYDLRVVELAPVLEEVTALVAPLAAAKQLDYTVALPAPALSVRVDQDRLRQVLLNLLSNAIKFTPIGGQVTVGVVNRTSAARAAGPEATDHVFVRVSDTGVGIPADKLEAVFAPFIQVESGFTRATGGTGLGLAISRDLARGMGGDLRARSQTGVGSTFTLMMPRA